MLIKEKALQHWIDNFYGYGSWDARIWFIGYEEGGGDVPEDVAERLDYFNDVHRSSTDASLCDIRELYRHVTLRLEGPKGYLFKNRFEYRFGHNAIPHGVWKNLISFVHGYRNEDFFDPLDYQKNAFASSTGYREALIQLYPLPSPHNHAWYYSWLDLPQLGFLKTRDLYQEHLYQRRISRILQKISESKPDLVLLYGMNNITALKESVQTFFPGVRFKMVKAIKQQIPQHHRADVDGTTLLMTTQIPALRHNRIETGFDWLAFGKTIASKK
jgi:hypothetical protein